MARTHLLLLVIALCCMMTLTHAKVCIFLHGSGMGLVAPPTSTSDYWGSVQNYVPQCTTSIFNHDDTTTQGWYNDNLMQRYCAVATGKGWANTIANNATLPTHEQLHEVISDFAQPNSPHADQHTRNLRIMSHQQDHAQTAMTILYPHESHVDLHQPAQQLRADSKNLQTGNLIHDSIVFTHSMGNLVLAAAIAKGYCDFDATSSWYEVSSPTHGSPAASAISKICDDTSSSVWNDGLVWLAGELGYCINKSSNGSENTNEAYVSMQPENPAFNTVPVKEVMSSRIKGAMCGTSAFGLVSKYSIPLAAIAAMSNFGELNDGMVAYSTCAVYGNFTSNYQDNFYQTATSHVDDTCRNGNGDFGTDRQPCSWFSHRQ